MTTSDDEELINQFLEWVEGAMSDLDTHMADLIKSGGGNKQITSEIYSLSHNLKGMGSSFNFDLVTNVGNSLCSYLKEVPENISVDVSVVEAHIKSFQVIIDHKITGDGGDKGKALIARLSMRVSEASKF